MSKCVLIVDDEEDVRAIAQMGLEMAAEWNILCASSGEEALVIAEQSDIGSSYHVVSLISPENFRSH